MIEIWKDVVGYENYYQVSNLGNIKSKDRLIEVDDYINHHATCRGFSYVMPGKIMKQRITQFGYKAVSLVNTHCIYEAAQYIDVNLIIKESEKLSYIALAIETKNMPSFSGIERFIEQFFRACKSAGLSFSWLQKLYIGKNCLNQFRQDNGYKEGTYKKVWNGSEDNVVMVELLKTIEDVSFDELYEQLKLKYNQN